MSWPDKRPYLNSLRVILAKEHKNHLVGLQRAQRAESAWINKEAPSGTARAKRQTHRSEKRRAYSSACPRSTREYRSSVLGLLSDRAHDMKDKLFEVASFFRFRRQFKQMARECVGTTSEQRDNVHRSRTPGVVSVLLLVALVFSLSAPLHGCP